MHVEKRIDIDILWCTDRYDGPVAGLCKTDGKYAYFYMIEENEAESGDWQRVYNVIQLPKRWIIYEHIRRLLFWVMVVKLPYDCTMMWFYKIFRPFAGDYENQKDWKVLGQYVR